MRLSLVKEKARLVGTCEELKAYLASMWKRLQKPVEECEAFLKKCESFTPQSLQLLQVRLFVMGQKLTNEIPPKQLAFDRL